MLSHCCHYKHYPNYVWYTFSFRTTNRLRRPVQFCCCARRVFASPTHDSPVLPNMIQQSTVETLPNSLQPFVLEVVHHWWLRQSTHNSPNVYLLSKSDFEGRLRVRSPSSHIFTVTVDRLRYCERIQREHKSNHIVYVFSFLSVLFYLTTLSCWISR